MRTSRQPSRKVTLADVAEQAGVSPTTVSFVLAGREMGISTATADRVHEAARVLGYQRQVRRLTASSSRMPVIGFITDAVASDHYGGEMIHGASTAAGARGAGLVTVETERQRHLEDGMVHELMDRGVERFVYAALATRAVRLPQALLDRATVLLNCEDPRSIATAVVPDEAYAGSVATQTLLDAGHTDRIWLVGETGRGPYAGRERRKAILQTLDAAGSTLANQVHCRWWPPQARQGFATALAAVPRAQWPTAVIAMNDRVAMGVYQAVAEQGLSIPKHLSVVSFDNSELAWWLSPGLTSVGLPYFDMGRRAVEVLLGAPATQAVERLHMPLHRRDSVAKPVRRRP